MEPRDPDRRHGDAAALRRPEGVKPRGGGREGGVALVRVRLWPVMLEVGDKARKRAAGWTRGGLGDPKETERWFC